MKRRFRIFTITILILFAISLSINIAAAVNQGAEPGSEQDPIVSKSYVDAAITQLAGKVQLLQEQNDTLKAQNKDMSVKLASQEQAIKALQEELKTVKSGASTGTSTSGGTGNKGGTGSTGSTTGSGTTGGTAANPPASAGKATINTAVLNLRAQPNTTSTILGKLVINETVTIVSKSGDWYKITTAKGKTGFVMAKFVTIKK